MSDYGIASDRIVFVVDIAAIVPWLIPKCSASIAHCLFHQNGDVFDCCMYIDRPIQKMSTRQSNAVCR